MRREVSVSKKAARCLMRLPGVTAATTRLRRYGTYHGETGPAAENLMNLDFCAAARIKILMAASSAVPTAAAPRTAASRSAIAAAVPVTAVAAMPAAAAPMVAAVATAPTPIAPDADRAVHGRIRCAVCIAVVRVIRLCVAVVIRRRNSASASGCRQGQQYHRCQEPAHDRLPVLIWRLRKVAGEGVQPYLCLRVTACGCAAVGPFSPFSSLIVTPPRVRTAAAASTARRCSGW